MATSGQQCNRCFRGRWVTRGVYDGVHGCHIRYLRCDFCGVTDKQVCQSGEVKRRKSASA